MDEDVAGPCQKVNNFNTDRFLRGTGEFKAFYLTLGHYDMVVISEAPNDEAYATTMLAIGSAGAVRSETLKAFTEDEYRKIISAFIIKNVTKECLICT